MLSRVKVCILPWPWLWRGNVVAINLRKCGANAAGCRWYHESRLPFIPNPLVRHTSAYPNFHNIHITKPLLGFGQLLASAESNWTTHRIANNDKENQTAQSTCQTRFWILFGMSLMINDSMIIIHLQEHQAHFKNTEVPCLHWAQTSRTVCWQGHLVQKHSENWNQFEAMLKTKGKFGWPNV